MKHYSELTRTSLFVDPEKWGEIARIIKQDPDYKNNHTIVDEALEIWLSAYGNREKGLAESLPFRGQLMESLLRGNLGNIQDQLRSALITLSERNAVFKTKVQSGGRISIPEAEREAIGIREGDIIQVFLYPVKSDAKSD